MWAAYHASPRPAINMLWEWVAYGLCFVLARQLIVTRREARAVVVVMIALGVAVAGYGLYQNFCEFPVTRAEFVRDPEAALRSLRLAYEPGSRDYELFWARLDTIRPMATFALANSLAGFLAPWLVLLAAVGGGVVARNRPEWTKPQRLLVCLGAGLGGATMAVCLALTSSRTGCLAVLLGGLIVSVLLGREMRGMPDRLAGWKRTLARLGLRLLLYGPGVVAIAGIVAVAALAAGGVGRGVLSGAATSVLYRIEYWRSTAQMIADYPLVGCGPGNFKDTYTQYMLPEASEEIADPHNFVMETWATAGTPALAALLAVLGCYAYALVRYYRAQSRSEKKTPSPRRDTISGNVGGHVGSPFRDTVRELDATPYVVGGGLFGFLLSVPVGEMSFAPPWSVEVVSGLWVPTVVLVGLPLAVVTVLLLWRWIEAGSLSPGWLAVGVLVLLVNLLAAGALGFPGIIGSLWLLMALSLNLAQSGRAHALPWGAGLAAMAATLALAFACSRTALDPVLQSQAAFRAAERDPVHADQHLKDAAAADPLSASRWEELAERTFDRWAQRRTPETFADFDSSAKAALELAPRSASTWQEFAECYFRAFLITRREDALQKAVSSYRRAVDLYPNNASIRASLALVLRAAGDEAGFEHEASVALSLDARTPHSDRKLKEDVRGELAGAVSRSSSRDP
jgi:tetratricopeptide (TPR) repeat protein